MLVYFFVFLAEIFLLLMTLLVTLFCLYTAYAMYKAAPFVPTSRPHVEDMLAIAKLQSSDTLMDLGSGDGRILLKASQLVKEAVGIEINPVLYWWSRFILRKKVNVSVRRENLWLTDLSGISVLTLFFIAHKMDLLQKKIRREMKPGSRVVSYGFRFPNWQYSEKNDKVYLYIV